MGLSDDTPLKRLSKDLQPGMPVGSAWLAQRGISPQLAYRYGKSGWLQPLARGVFARPGEQLDRDKSLRLLVDLGHRVHVGGKTALAWHGYRHNLSLGREKLTLYRQGSRSLPDWFTRRFPSRVDSRQLFDEPAESGMNVAESPDHADMPVSETERAALEMLSEIPAKQGVDEAGSLMESLVSLRSDAMRNLLNGCKSRKTVLLFFHFARKFDLPVLAFLSPEQWTAGSKSRYVLKLPHGTLALKP